MRTTPTPPASATAATDAVLAGYEDLCLYIDGEFIGGGSVTSAVTNPANGGTIAQLPHASGADLDRALAARPHHVVGSGSLVCHN